MKTDIVIQNVLPDETIEFESIELSNIDTIGEDSETGGAWIVTKDNQYFYSLETVEQLRNMGVAV